MDFKRILSKYIMIKDFFFFFYKYHYENRNLQTSFYFNALFITSKQIN